MIGAIAVEGSRCAGRVGERYIGVRSEQIRGVPGQARRVVFRSPVKDMQRHVVTGAPSHQFGAGRAIDMDLPGYRREGFEIILSIDWHPWEPVAAMDMTGGASAQGAAAVIQGNLRDRPKDVLANRLEPSAVAKLNTRSVVATNRRAKPIRSAS